MSVAWRGIGVRYEPTAPGVAWAILQPSLRMLTFSVVFSGLPGQNRVVGDHTL